MYEWSRGIFAKKSKLHDAGGPDTVVSPCVGINSTNLARCDGDIARFLSDKWTTSIYDNKLKTET